VQVFRFDPEVAMTVRGGGSPAKLGELVGTSSLESAGVVFLDEGSRYEVGPSEFHRLIALTAGSCTVDAAGLSPFVLSVNQAFVAGPQESCSLLARESLVALAMEGSFDVWAVAVTQDIAVVPYNAAWPEWFARISNQLQPFVRDHALRIDHVGSTSVLGLAAKPIIDIDVVASSEDQVPSLIERITRAGYRWRGDLGVTGREAFSPTFDQGLPEHHLYLVVENNKAHLDHLLLRDVLRSDARLRDEYAALKLSNVDAAQGNMDVYLAAKARFVARVLAQARRDRGLPQAEYWIPSLEENSTTES
jgi:GrpB-like predicted nucleotidyltransferase (UPF0157 family)